MIEFKGCFCIISDYTYLINIGWIRIRMDPELLPGSGSGTRKIQSWIRIRNKSFRIRNTGTLNRRQSQWIFQLTLSACSRRLWGFDLMWSSKAFVSMKCFLKRFKKLSISFHETTVTIGGWNGRVRFSTGTGTVRSRYFCL